MALWHTRRLFLGGLAACYMSAFASLHGQLPGLIGATLLSFHPTPRPQFPPICCPLGRLRGALTDGVLGMQGGTGCSPSPATCGACSDTWKRKVRATLPLVGQGFSAHTQPERCVAGGSWLAFPTLVRFHEVRFPLHLFVSGAQTHPRRHCPPAPRTAHG
jgi:hypothetical protein